MAVSDNTNAISWMTKKRAKKGAPRRLLETFLDWVVTHELTFVGVYSGAYHNVSADALTRSKVGPIEIWMQEQGFSWVELPEIWTGLRNSATKRSTDLNIRPFGFSSTLDSPLPIAEWGPSGYSACFDASTFGLSPIHACARHPFVTQIASSVGILSWRTSGDFYLICGSWGN